MVDLIRQSIKEISGREIKVHITREFLQLLILKIIYDENYFKNLAFVGGTALRILYNLRRFSEDLDFSLINKKGYKFDSFLGKITYELRKYGFSVEIKKTQKNLFNQPCLNLKMSCIFWVYPDKKTKNFLLKLK